MQRRQLIQSLTGAAALGAAGISGRLMAAPAAGGNKLLVVFLRGGYDANHLLVPHANRFYYESRPKIAVPRPGEANGALRLDEQWGLHPALADSVMPLFAKGQAAFLPFAGTDDTSRSHFETQDTVEMGQAPAGPRDYDSGFMNRLAQVLSVDSKAKGRGARVQPIAFTDRLPIILRGTQPAANMALANVGKQRVDTRQSQVIQAMYRGTALEQSVVDGFEVRNEVLRAAQQEMDASARQAMSAKGFELVARRMARLMNERYNLAFVDVGGWDTHVGQGAGTGYLANRFEQLGRGLAGFAQEIGESDWKRTVVVVVSEFGRTFRENGNAGTDHGHGTTYWLLGGGLSAKVGGRVIGRQNRLTPTDLFQDRDTPVLNEVRGVFAGLFGRMYGLPPARLGQVFDGVAPIDLQIV